MNRRILLTAQTAGRGWYQEEGKPVSPRKMSGSNP